MQGTQEQKSVKVLPTTGKATIDIEKDTILRRLGKVADDIIDLKEGDYTYDIVRHLYEIAEQVARYKSN